MEQNWTLDFKFLGRNYKSSGVIGIASTRQFQRLIKI